MKKTIVASLATAALLVTTVACDVPEGDNKPGAQRATTSANDTPKDGQAKDGDKVKPDKPADGPKESVSQANARASAEDYLAMSAFSRKGLIQQLKFEGFNLKDATYGADAVGADWMEQAAKSAKSYLEFDSFSRQGLIQQLVFEGFTQEQAAYGVKKTGL